MKTFSTLLALCAGNSPVTGEFSHKKPVARGFDVFFDLRLNKNLSKKCEAGDLRRHRAHFDVTVMETMPCTVFASTVITKFGSEFVRDWHWKSDMMTSWNRNAFDITGPIRQRSYERSMIRCFDVFFVVSLKKLLNKQSSCGWFQTPWRSCVTLKQVGVYASAAPMLEM